MLKNGNATYASSVFQNVAWICICNWMKSICFYKGTQDINPRYISAYNEKKKRIFILLLAAYAYNPIGF